MRINFFETPCREPVRTDKLFGICDNQDGSKAFTDIDDQQKWIALVKNEQAKRVSFTPIDNCIDIFKVSSKDQESTCDGMLIFQESLFLVELKDRERDWQPKAISQLENTIRLLHIHHDLSIFRYKKAYACNKRHPNFVVIESSTKKDFYIKTKGFRIDLQAEIEIK